MGSLIRRNLLLVVSVASLSVAAAACGDDDLAPGDGGTVGLDSGGGGPMDAGEFDAARRDAGTRECVGTPTECAILDPAMCSTVMGCFQTRCVGFAIACEMRSRTECMASMFAGCTWTGSACTGGALRCGDVSDKGMCRLNTGCTWGADSCRGAPVACETLARDACTTQPGCMIYVPPFDAGPPMPDAGCGTFDAGMGMVDLNLRVVEDTEPLMPLADAHVRVESTCGGMMEGVTAADGTVHFSIDRAMGPWDLTAAKAGYAAVSVLDVAGFAFSGDIRLDPYMRPDELPYLASGTLGGTVGIGHTVQVDAYNFETIMGAGPTWSANFYASALSLRQPLVFTAIELDAMGRAVNIASAEMPRVTMPVTGIALNLPSPAEMPITSTYNVVLTPGGMVSAADATVVGAYVVQLSTLDEGEYLFVGAAQLTVAGMGLRVDAQHFPGPVATNFVRGTVDGAMARLNFYKSDPTVPTDIVVGPGTMALHGSSLGDLEVEQTGAMGHDVVAIHIGESDTESPHWRVYAPTLPQFTRVPHLPSMVTLSDIGLTPASSTTVLPLFIEMESGAAWSARSDNEGVAGYQYSLAPGYTPISTTGR